MTNSTTTPARHMPHNPISIWNVLGYALMALACYVSVFVNTELFPDKYFAGRWLGFLACVAAGLLLLAARHAADCFGNRASMVRSEATGTAWPLVLCLLTGLVQAIYAIVLCLSQGGKASGSFDNEAGLAVCLAGVLPFVGICFSGRSPNPADSKNLFPRAESGCPPQTGKPNLRFPWLSRICSWATALTLSAAIALSGSRTGLLALTIVGMAAPTLAIPGHRKAKCLIFPAVAVGLVVALYFVRPASADGRLLIWRCSWEMIKEKPSFGWGINGFRAHYMDFQADWLAGHPGSRFSQLAGDVTEAFNGLVGTGVRFGLAGVALLLAAIGGLFCLWRSRRQCPLCRMAGLSLLAIGVCACFSYPFNYPFTWLVVLTDVGIIAGPTLKRAWRLLPVKAAALAAALVLALAGGGLCLHLSREVPAQIRWHRLEMDSPFPDAENAFGEYARLEKYLGKNPYFRYNYAAELFAAGRYGESLGKALLCRKLWAEYDLQLLIGQNHEQLGHLAEAEKAYRQAADMCPCRFYPLYLLALLYENNGRHEEALRMADIILQKPVKVPSAAVNIILARMRELREPPAQHDNCPPQAQ